MRAEVKAGGGRVLLRYSGTEPKARFIIEGPDQNVLDKWADQVCKAIQERIGEEEKVEH